jgi:hypothetical protein
MIPESLLNESICESLLQIEEGPADQLEIAPIQAEDAAGQRESQGAPSYLSAVRSQLAAQNDEIKAQMEALLAEIKRRDEGAAEKELKDTKGRQENAMLMAQVQDLVKNIRDL